MSLTRILNKTPIANEKSNVYEIENVDSQLITQILQSRFVGEGVYCLEQFSMPDYKENYLITPSFDKHNGTTTDKEWNFKGEDIKELTMFELVLEKPMFMPLDTKQVIDLFNNLPNTTVFTQVLLCKRLDNWRENAIHQYTSYLNGNDSPTKRLKNLKIIILPMIHLFNKYHKGTTASIPICIH
jgi:S-DNA-T family DNA segregation ATPase FtsK/SpoIIIE